jgi:hypothetical protein
MGAGGRKMKVIVKLAIVAVLIGLLNACTVSFSVGGFQPTRDVVQRAIALQLSQTQAQLRQHLSQYADGDGRLPDYQIERVEIRREDPLKVGDLLTYHVQGTYNLSGRAGDRRFSERDNAFDLYLQRQREGKTWRLAVPLEKNKETDEQQWATYLVKPPGYI